MRTLAWLVIVAAIGGIGFMLLRMRRQWDERRRQSEQRLASMVLQAAPAATPAAPPAAAAPSATPVSQEIVQDRLLFDAASKAGEAGEPALAIQLYARLIARYPQSALAQPARAAVEGQKKRLAKP